MIRLAKTRRRAVVPWAPMTGNRLFASEAPDCMEAMAINNKPMGNRTLGFAILTEGEPSIYRRGSAGGRRGAGMLRVEAWRLQVARCGEWNRQRWRNVRRFLANC
jgi:hypothetical protein